MMVLLMNSEIKNERFIAVAKNLSFKEILTQLKKALEKPQPKKQLQYWQLEVGVVLDFIWCALTGRARSITKNTIHSMKHRDAYDNIKVKDFLNFEFEDLNATIDFSCQRFLEENL